MSATRSSLFLALAATCVLPASAQFGPGPPPGEEREGGEEKEDRPAPETGKPEKEKPEEGQPGKEKPDEAKKDGESETPPEKVKPSVKQLDEDRFQIGEIVFNKKSREIRFPTVVNMTEGQLEFLVVHKNGKTHESLLATDISPMALNIAFALLRYPASKEFSPLPSETGGASNEYPEVPEKVKEGARITIEVEWKEGERTRRVPANDWVQHGVKGSAMPPGPWVYGGSDVANGKFAAESTGDIVAIYLAPAAMVNYPGVDHDNDDVWTPFPKRVPTEGTPVTLIITPNKAKPGP